MKALEKVKVTPELKEYYKRVGLFLKQNPSIKSRKLALGYEVDISTISDDLVEKWLAVCLT
jgi:hypothetical protein